MENYSLLMGAAAVMKMAVEMAAVSMEKPSGALPRPAGEEPDDVVDEEGDALGIPKLRRLSLLKICRGEPRGIPKLRAFTPLDHSISFSSLDP
ncbi:hypothetical protein QYE76_064180 [Lolium multiflorum]|uniref:Uncharacterized protein n=1 Tax=Lolium multiflorum TaxID=4521 RepID=A0AAD8S711_LOLMU|nr:hypothetical protein QYE76_064180 [Lolium multiflorum]